MLDFGKKKNTNADGVRLLAAILVCFPEIATVSYEPKDKSLNFTFTLKKTVTQKDFDELTGYLAENIHTYQILEGMGGGFVDFSMEAHDDMAFLHLNRDMATMTRGEINVVTTVLRDRLGDELLTDSNSPDRLETGFSSAQEELLDKLFDNIQDVTIVGRLVGVREDNHIVVFDH